MAEHKRAGLADRAYDHLKHLLITGDINHQDWFPIEQIAGSLNTSRQPVMDALRRLAIEGFVEIVPQVGCRPKRPELCEIQDFFRFLADGEALIAELAAQRAQPGDIVSLQLISAQIGALSNHDASAEMHEIYRTLNRQLHRELRRIARSPALAEIIEGLGYKSDFFIAFANGERATPDLRAAHAEHEQIIEAIAAGDSHGARSAMMRHVAATEHRIEEEIRATA